MKKKNMLDFTLLQIVFTIALIIVGAYFIYTERRLSTATIGAIIIIILSIFYDVHLINKLRGK